MRILCVIDSLGSGGAQRQMSYLALGLNAQGHDVELFLYQPRLDRFRQSIENAGIPIHDVWRDGDVGFSPLALLQLTRRILEGVDAVISFQQTANFYSAIARLASPSVQLIVGERTSSAARLSAARRFQGWLSSYLANFVVANSETHAEHLRQLPGLSRKVVAIWNGYEIVSSTSFPRTGRLGLKRLLVIARVSAEKNGLRLLQGLAIFHARHGWMPKVRWAGRRDDDPASRHIQRDMDDFLANHPRICENWTWLGEVENVEELYRTSDSLILPSLFEGLPNVICEAMLAGCPVIASDVCDHPLLLGKGEERGLFCDPRSPESICDAIERMNAMTLQERAQLTLQAQVFAKEHFSLNRMVLSYERLLKNHLIRK